MTRNPLWYTMRVVMNVPMLDLQAQHRAIRDEVRRAVEEVLDSQMCVLGPAVRALEDKLDRMVAPAKTLGVSSGTDALLLALMACDIGPGDEVILPTFTFFATAAAAVRVGAKPVFVDIDQRSFNTNADLIEKALTAKTKAIIPVHLFGQCAAIEPIIALATARGLRVIEDAAQALGALRNGKPACTFGDIACVSFYPTKNLGAAGEAGLLATADPDLYERCLILRNQGMEPRYEHHYVGGNFRMDAIQAAILNVKCDHLADWNAKRARNAALYDELLADARVITPCVADKNTHVYHQYTIRTDNRDALKSHLTEKGIGSDVYYPIPLHLQPCFRTLGYHKGDFPVSEEAASKVLALPIYPELSEQQIRYVAQTIHQFSLLPSNAVAPAD